MPFLDLALKNIFNISVFCFIGGITVSFIKKNIKLPSFLSKLLPLYILFLIGLKGGGALDRELSSTASVFFILTTILAIWGFLQPFISFYILKVSTKIDLPTAAAVASAFGSVSVMTFVTGASFLESLDIPYQEFLIATMAIMEIPALISGLLLGKIYGKNRVTKINQVIRHALFNFPIVCLILGLLTGAFLEGSKTPFITTGILSSFKPVLCLFLFGMGLTVGSHRHDFRLLSWRLNLFGVYMPLIGGLVGLMISSLLQLDVGTKTMVAVLTASASYIAVPAAMRIALPEAKEAVYLPLSLGITFPFNVLCGIPLYYCLAKWVTS